MQLADALEFIRARHQGILIATKSDGRPQSSNVAYAVRGDGTIVVSVTDGRAKTTNLRRRPQASLHVNADDFGSYAVVEADVVVTPVATSPDDETTDKLVEYFKAVAGEHSDWDDYRRAMVADGRLVLELTPTRAYGFIG
jgi:PPOX class probable F420-dependent enzyme